MGPNSRTSKDQEHLFPSTSAPGSETTGQNVEETSSSEEKGLCESQTRIRAEAVLRKLDRHLLCKFLILTILCYLDRTNLAFAALTLNSDLKLTSSEYGIGSGIFFLGYTIFQVPSNIMLVQIGARAWLAILVVFWGIVAMAFAGLQSTFQFYMLRFLLGAAESGTMPGMWYHMSLFYSENELTVAWSWVLVGIALSQVIGGPIAAGFLAMDGILGLHGWQWLFVIEGLLTVLMGVYIAGSLADGPSSAVFLEPEERDWLHERNSDLNNKAVGGGAATHGWEAAKCLQTWHLAAISMLANIPKYGIIFWCPLIIDSLLDGATQKAVVALLSSLPFGVAAIAIILNAQHSKATGERRFHVAVPLAIAAVALGILSFLIRSHPGPSFAALLVAAVVWAADPVMASWPATFLRDTGAATGVALINSVGSIGGFMGPYIIGAVKDAGGGYTMSMLLLALACAAVAILSILFPDRRCLKRRSSGNMLEAL